MFEKTAKILKENIADPSLRAMVALEFVELFKASNKNFDTDRFLLATKRNSGQVWHYGNGHTIKD